MQKKIKQTASAASVFYLTSIVWFLVAIFFFLSEGSRTMGCVFLPIGSMWLCLGSVFARRRKKEEQNLKYYNENAEAFAAGTMTADMSETRERFLRCLPEKGSVLDWGCGSGRDSLAFKAAGYQVEATDASEALSKLASDALGQEVRCESFEVLDEKAQYDGIWACASLLHVERERIPEIIEVALRALKPGGVLYMSFKYGAFEGERDGRFFTDMNEELMAKALKYIRHQEVLEQWITEDVRPDRSNKWLNVLVKKTK